MGLLRDRGLRDGGYLVHRLYHAIAVVRACKRLFVTVAGAANLLTAPYAAVP
jgi:hypothetical protein